MALMSSCHLVLHLLFTYGEVINKAKVRQMHGLMQWISCKTKKSFNEVLSCGVRSLVNCRDPKRKGTVHAGNGALSVLQ